MSTDYIIIKGAREHNLKNIDLEIPKDKLVVLTGISGSGKSSLAFDTLYAEGQRRYVESLSSYARQFLGVMDKPDVDYIEGLSPAISIDQKSASHNPRSTVGTTTEIYDYLRLLFARIGHPHCPICGEEVSRMSVEQVAQSIIGDPTSSASGGLRGARGRRIMVLAPIVKDRKGEYSQLFEDLKKKGYSKVRIDGYIRDLTEDLVLIKTNKHTIDVVIDRLVLNKDAGQTSMTNIIRSRLSQSIETALKLGEGFVIISDVLDTSLEFPATPAKMQDHLYSERFACPKDNIALPEIEPRTFSFNSPHGACPNCTGLGALLKVDPSVILNPILSIAEGGILPMSNIGESDTWFSRLIEAVGKTYHFDLKIRLGEFSDEARTVLLYGAVKEEFKVEGRNREGRWTHFYTDFEGIINNLERRYKETESEYVRREIEKYMVSEICPVCAGARLKKEALSVTINRLNISQMTEFSIKDALEWVKNLKKPVFSDREATIASSIVKEIIARLQFLVDVGLDYLTLNRASMTLAGGEAQRIRLASQIGSGLSGVLYVLDEPSIGLHQRDNHRLIETLKRLRDLGNTVVVVEHDAETMENADFIIDFGPGAGEHGGKVMAQGSPAQIKKNPESLTGKYLSGKKTVNASQKFIKAPNNLGVLKVLGAAEHNLKNIDVEFPLGQFIAVTGVSGSGKSTLINDILYKALSSKFFHSRERAGKHQGLEGVEKIDKVVLVDQSPIGRTPRSNPATYTGAFTFIRELFANSPESKIKGYSPGRFSFNVKGGRCEVCEGEGQIKIEMQFLPDVYVTCEACGGKRYNREALDIHFKDKNIAEILDMTVEEALKFFENIPQIKNKLVILNEVGLGYIRLGQPAPTVSGGEAQRIKLATELSKRPTGHTLYILDEPTTGLHFADIEKLLTILRRLVNYGNTVIIIEHNLDVIKNTDWIIDLGPEGGDGGGKIVAEGTPKQLAGNKNSITGHYLSKVLVQ
ncbi:excinuclease ABC subunit A [Candidatus Daviesbacteria bacterium RIFOXYD1_FULL_41_10]|uniref:UvrABC system protein A n=1 Tax=Candidatus Daviesbacteria bacterium RIFOXYD1_FULL_41_10 TaxID=1797801 RepID=A0A1F5N337_9BACT|nr:MAG: excinuclease ABC subunit A [Candidatus Daviesbacteria bacterium RIFOXYD1_FULL_41_10]